jgi:hypothetical protein
VEAIACPTPEADDPLADVRDAISRVLPAKP